MRLICPHCMSGVTVPDDAAGKDATCPNCGKTFPTPARYSAAVVPDPPPPPPPPAPEVAPPPSQVPAAPPGYIPPAPAPAPAGGGFLPPAAPQAAGGEVPAAAGYTKSLGITFAPRVVAVLPAAFLTLALVFTFFPWVGTYFGGSAVYSQGPWRAVFGSVSKNTELERAAPPETIGWEKDKVPSDWYLMLPFLLVLLAAAALALADRGFSSRDPQRLPPRLAKIWPVRHMIIAVLSVVAVALVVIQSLNGFGLERAAQQVVQERLAKEREEAKGDAVKGRVVDQREDDELRKFHLSRTSWMHCAVLFTAFGALAAVGTIVLDRRGNKPPPKLLLHY